VPLNEPSLHRRNGQTREIDADQEMPLLWALRDLLGLTGTQLGCGEGLCGACTVHLDGAAPRSCRPLPDRADHDRGGAARAQPVAQRSGDRSGDEAGAPFSPTPPGRSWLGTMWTSTSDRAALASAVFAGTGRRLRSLPLQLEA
jgi:hypothetical protein